MPVRIQVWGDGACFTRPEMKVERVSYDVMTPSAARGILDSIYWHPGMIWRIDRIHVCAPIRFTSVRRKEVKSVINSNGVRRVMRRGSGELYLDTAKDTQLRGTLMLTNVRYVIDAHFDLTDSASPGVSEGKFLSIFSRRAAKGQCYQQPCFGCREFPASFAPCEELPPCPEELKGVKELGWMLYDMNWEYYNEDRQNRDLQPRFFRAALHDGVLDVPGPFSEEVHG